MLWRAEVSHPRVRLAFQMLLQRHRQSRLADARFAREQHHLAFAGLCFRPPPHQQFEFFFSTDKLGQAARVKSIEAAFHGSGSQCHPSSHRPCDTLEVPGSEVLKLEQVAKELSRTPRR